MRKYEYMRPQSRKPYVKLAYDKGYRATKSGDILGTSGKTRKLVVYGNKNYPYLGFTLAIPSTKRKVWVFAHQLQAYQKFGDEYLLSDLVVRHLNSDSLDNSYENIDIGTQKENMLDVSVDVRLKRSHYAAKTQRKVSPEQVVEIRNKKANGHTLRMLMGEYGLAKSTLSYIVNNKTFRRVGADGVELEP